MREQWSEQRDKKSDGQEAENRSTHRSGERRKDGGLCVEERRLCLF